MSADASNGHVPRNAPCLFRTLLLAWGAVCSEWAVGQAAWLESAMAQLQLYQNFRIPDQCNLEKVKTRVIRFHPYVWYGRTPKCFAHVPGMSRRSVMVSVL